MRKYKIVALLWQDHTHFERTGIPSDPDASVMPTLTVGILYKETKRYYIIISDIERYGDRDEASYTIIFKPVLGLQEYGLIEVNNIREV